MGYACNEKNVLLCLSALDSVLAGMGAAIESGKAVNAARGIYNR